MINKVRLKKYQILIILAIVLCSATVYFLTKNNIKENQVCIYDDSDWAMQNTGQTVKGQDGKEGVDINIVPAHNMTTGNSNILVGVVDTGIDFNCNALKII